MRAASSSALRSRPSSASSRSTSGVDYVVGVANGTDALTIALRAMGVGPGRRCRRPGVHVLRVRRGDSPDRRASRLLRRRSADDDGRRPRPCTRPSRPPRRRSSPCTCSATSLRSVRSRRSASRCLRTRLRRRARPVRTGAPARSARRRRSASSPPRTSGASVTAARSPPRERRSPSSRGCCASTAPATSTTWELVGYNSRLDEIQAAFLRVLLPELDGWARGRCTAAAHYERAGLGELVALPIRRPARVPPGTCTSSVPSTSPRSRRR